jgi:hypothetical protein
VKRIGNQCKRFFRLKLIPIQTGILFLVFYKC